MSERFYAPSTHLALQVRCDHTGLVRVHLETWDDGGENSACSKQRMTATRSVELFRILGELAQLLEHPESGELG